MHTIRAMLQSATLLLFALAAPAWAEDGKTLASSACRAVFSGENAIATIQGRIFNISNTNFHSIICPVVKDLSRIKRAEVRVFDRNSEQFGDITCDLLTMRSNGTIQQRLTERSSDSSNFEQALSFGAMSAAANGSCYLECRLPPRSASFDTSSIVQYTIAEE